MKDEIRDIKNIEKFVKYGEAQVYIEDMQLDILYECFRYLEPNVNIDDIEQCNWHGYEQEFSICVHNYDCCDWDIYNVPAKVFDYWMEGEKDKALDLYKKTIETEKWKDPRETKTMGAINTLGGHSPNNNRHGKVFKWFFRPDNQATRSAVCLIGMVATAVDIYYVCACPFDTVFDLVTMGVAILVAMVLFASTWTLLEYIIKND